MLFSAVSYMQHSFKYVSLIQPLPKQGLFSEAMSLSYFRNSKKCAKNRFKISIITVCKVDWSEKSWVDLMKLKLKFTSVGIVFEP